MPPSNAIRCFVRQLVAAGLLVTGSAQAADLKTMLDQAQALLREGKGEAAYQLLEPQEDAYAGDILFDYVLGASALESGKPSKATFVYERILAIDPGYIGVRADMGRAYYLLGDYARAKIEFETVMTARNLPIPLKAQVEQYISALDARTQAKPTTATGYAEFGIGRDSNVGSASGLTELNLPASGVFRPTPPTGIKVRDSYATLALGGEVNHAVDEKFGVYGGADYRIRDYRQFNDPNNWSLDGRVGVTYSGGNWLLRTGLTAGEYHYNAQRLRDTVGAVADWRMALSPSSQLTLGGSLLRISYVPELSRNQKSNTYTANGGWLTAIGNGTGILSLSGVLGFEDAIGGRDDGDRRFWGPRATVQSSFGKDFGGYVTMGATRSTYSGVNSSYLFERRETLFDFTAAVTWAVAKGISLRPQVSYYKNSSNAQLYSYDKTDASVNLRFDY